MDTAIHKTQNVQNILKYTYGLVPIVAGLDKFSNLLTRWEEYVSAPIANILPFSTGTFIAIVGIIEIAAGVLVLLRPAVGGYVVMAWLIAIALTLVAGGEYFDVAVRDLVMAAGAFALAKLSEVSTDQRSQP